MAQPLGKLLRERRESRELTMREVSVAAPIGLGYLSRLEQGKAREPGPRVLARLALVLDPDRTGFYGDLMRAAGYL